VEYGIEVIPDLLSQVWRILRTADRLFEGSMSVHEKVWRASERS
jgi:hypothetical protein